MFTSTCPSLSTTISQQRSGPRHAHWPGSTRALNLTLEPPYFCTEWEPLQCEFTPVALRDRLLAEAVPTSPLLLEAIPPIMDTSYRQAAVKLPLPRVTTCVFTLFHSTHHIMSSYPNVFKTYSVDCVPVTCLTPLSVTSDQARTTFQILSQKTAKWQLQNLTFKGIILS